MGPEQAPPGAPGATTVPTPVLPDYGGPCLSGVLPAILGRRGEVPAPWLPPAAVEASQVVLLVLDGLGWEQLAAHRGLTPGLSAMSGGAISSVVPTTTATALTSITTGTTPAVHGVVGYRVRVDEDRVMNVLRWRVGGGDARMMVPPVSFQPLPAFGASEAPAVTRSEFAETGFTAAHLGGARLRGWRMPSSLVVEVARLARQGEPFIYAYYDGIDKVAHEWGLEEHYRSELAFADRLVSEVAAALPPGVALVVTSDHGQVAVGDAVVPLADEVTAEVTLVSGEGRFRWLHARPGATEAVAERARAAYGHLAWVRTRDEAVDEGWFGGPLRPGVAERLGDVALVPHAPVAFGDPADTGELKLVSRHGSLTAEEMWVPLLVWVP
ncbi:MAG TPA: alkaline phosphatase family protein [Acidimicrobiales bacterium]|nr:alkaline phosphatase family protein [Acidimicrobiales bacterium]